MNRRKTVMLAVAGMISIVTGSRRARAELDPRRDGPTATADNDASGLRNATPASAAQARELKAVGPQAQVTAIQHRGDTFEVTTADGRKAVVQQTNLRIKIDTSDHGPFAGKPVILPGGTMATA
jgi:cytochrome c